MQFTGLRHLKSYLTFLSLPMARAAVLALLTTLVAASTATRCEFNVDEDEFSLENYPNIDGRYKAGRAASCHIAYLVCPAKCDAGDE